MTETEARRARLRRAAAFFGVAIPALTGAAHEAALEDTIIAGCLEMQEKSHECKDAFVDVILDRQLAKAGTSLTPAQRAAVREVRLRRYDWEVTGPLQRRRVNCKRLIESMEPRAKHVALAKQKPLKACYANRDCGVRARCFVGVLEQVGIDLAGPPEK